MITQRKFRKITEFFFQQFIVIDNKKGIKDLGSNKSLNAGVAANIASSKTVTSQSAQADMGSRSTFLRWIIKKLEKLSRSRNHSNSISYNV